jgi:hypothetical protein
MDRKNVEEPAPGGHHVKAATRRFTMASYTLIRVSIYKTN